MPAAYLLVLVSVLLLGYTYSATDGGHSARFGRNREGESVVRSASTPRYGSSAGQYSGRLAVLGCLPNMLCGADSVNPALHDSIHAVPLVTGTMSRLGREIRCLMNEAIGNGIQVSLLCHLLDSRSDAQAGHLPR